MSTDPISKYNSYGTDFCSLRTDTYPFINPSKADLTGKHVLITGASRGLGETTAISYATAGASAIIITARSDLSSTVKKIHAAAKDAKRPEPTVLALKMDVSNQSDVQAAAATVKQQVGHIDILLLNAGVLEPNAKILDSDPEVWWQTYQINTFGSYLCTRAFLPLLLASPKPDRTIVTYSSIGANLNSSGYSSYQVGKVGQVKFSEFINAEYGAKEDGGILSFSIHPGSVATSMGDSLLESLRANLTDTPQLCGDTLVWLTNERREWLAGRYISVQWDMQEFESKRKAIEERDLLKIRLAMGHEKPTS